jgi:PHD/YefM family antitoxin component YafN of YafNO toxin-antitoxin module
MSTSAREPEVITRGGKPVSIILPIKEYQALIERLEDAEDAAYLKKARTKPLSYRPLKDYLAEHRKARV